MRLRMLMATAPTVPHRGRTSQSRYLWAELPRPESRRLARLPKLTAPIRRRASQRDELVSQESDWGMAERQLSPGQNEYSDLVGNQHRVA
jgi:hypothetical protein